MSAACEGAAEVDSVERWVLSAGMVWVVAVRSAGRAGELEHEGLAVAARPSATRTLHIRSQPGHGTSLSGRLPVPEPGGSGAGG